MPGSKVYAKRFNIPGKLPRELQVELYKHLSHTDTKRMQRVSKECFEAADDNQVWKSHFARDHEDMLPRYADWEKSYLEQRRHTPPDERTSIVTPRNEWGWKAQFKGDFPGKLPVFADYLDSHKDRTLSMWVLPTAVYHLDFHAKPSLGARRFEYDREAHRTRRRLERAAHAAIWAVITPFVGAAAAGTGALAAAVSPAACTLATGIGGLKTLLEALRIIQGNPLKSVGFTFAAAGMGVVAPVGLASLGAAAAGLAGMISAGLALFALKEGIRAAISGIHSSTPDFKKELAHLNESLRQAGEQVTVCSERLERLRGLHAAARERHPNDGATRKAAAPAQPTPAELAAEEEIRQKELLALAKELDKAKSEVENAVVEAEAFVAQAQGNAAPPSPQVPDNDPVLHA